MSNIRLTAINLAVVSASVLCFEILATRISSVIFINNYAFIILSLAILGLGCGGIFAHYKLSSAREQKRSRVLPVVLALLGGSLLAFILVVTRAPFVTNQFVYFFFLFLPFFFAGIFYACVFESFADKSFTVYAADLVGAAIGSIASIWVISTLGPTNGVLLILILTGCTALSYLVSRVNKFVIWGSYAILAVGAVLLIYNTHTNWMGRIPIGNFSEKDFYHAYPNMNVQPDIMESRWSIYGRSDLVDYSNQNIIRHLFVDGAAGTQMYRFNGKPDQPDDFLVQLLSRTTNYVPFTFLDADEKNSMLVIGPGGGKEVLTGLLMDVGEITGVEINPDFVDIVKEQERFNGGIYTDFPNVNIVVQEGRQFVKRKQKQFDLIVMALPSTEQLQNIDNFAQNENYLLTVEAIRDYIDNLTPEGRMIFTVHNRGELKRLITTTIRAFEERGISPQEALNHFMVLEQRYSPTIVIKKKPYSKGEIARRTNRIKKASMAGPPVTYLPYQWNSLNKSIINGFLAGIKRNRTSLAALVNRDQFDISATYDDSPYFYKIYKGIPDMFVNLFWGLLAINLVLIGLPLAGIKKRKKKILKLPEIRILGYFICLGLGFMIVEVTFFQKLILYLGSPTVSISILLSSLLVGMGMGSYFGDRIFTGNPRKRLFIITTSLIGAGLIAILLYPMLLSHMLAYDVVYRALTTFVLLLPFGFLLGIPFPTCIQLLKQSGQEQYIPWMYGVNGAMSVLGSVMAVIISMLYGFVPSFFIGLAFYLLIFLMLVPERKVFMKTG